MPIFRGVRQMVPEAVKEEEMRRRPGWMAAFRVWFKLWGVAEGAQRWA
jgi:hypothetical protein